MKILLTGATGFLGSKILRRLLEEKYQVVVLKRQTSNTKRIKEYLPQCSVYDTEAQELDEIFEKERPQAVIHCAAVYGRGDKNPVQVMEVNLMWSMQLLEAASKYECGWFINTGSYSTKQIEKNARVDHKIYMADYTLSKHQFICWGEEFAALGRMNFITMNLEHIFGEADDEGKFIYLVEQSCLKEKSLDLSDGMQLRDYIYSENVVDAYLCVLKHLEELRGFHQFEVGMGEKILLKEFVLMLKEVSGSDIKLNFGIRPRNDAEPACSVADITGLKALGWTPRFSRKQGVERMFQLDTKTGK